MSEGAQMSNELESDRAMVANLELLEPMVLVTMRPSLLGPVAKFDKPASHGEPGQPARGGGPSGAYIMMASDVDSTAEARPRAPPWPLPASRPGRTVHRDDCPLRRLGQARAASPRCCPSRRLLAGSRWCDAAPGAMVGSRRRGLGRAPTFALELSCSRLLRVPGSAKSHSLVLASSAQHAFKLRVRPSGGHCTSPRALRCP
jgi:hypothetical protein